MLLYVCICEREEVEEMKSVNMMLCCGTAEIEMVTCFNIYLCRLCNFLLFFSYTFSLLFCVFFRTKKMLQKKTFSKQQQQQILPKNSIK